MRFHRTGLASVLFARNRADATAVEEEEEDGF
jgi:hypothetical protein